MVNINYREIALSEENSEIRAGIWGDFVNWEKRRKGENGFLVKQFKEHKCRRILDVALGDGVDTIYLIQQGFDVSANEADNAFRAKAIENASRLGITINPTSADWKELTKVYDEGYFDSVLCAGNSLSCLSDRQDQLAALNNFYKVLRSGGVLIIDERNYQLLLDNKEAALKDKIHSSGNYVYTGTEAVGVKWLEFNDDYLTIEYCHKATGLRAYYLGHPFKRGEMLCLLRESGFSRIKRFYDFQPSNDKEPDYLQYACTK